MPVNKEPERKQFTLVLFRFAILQHILPEPILQLQRQLDQFRSTQPRRTKLPEPLWQAAVELARQHGVYPVADPLRLDYTRLKERLGGDCQGQDRQNSHGTVGPGAGRAPSLGLDPASESRIA